MADVVFVLDGTGEHHLFLMKFLNDNLGKDQCQYLFCGVSCNCDKIADDSNAEVISSFLNPSKEVNHLLETCRRIVVVGLFDPGLVVYLNTHRALLKKTAVVFHGGEFYGMRGNTAWKMRAFHLARRMVVAKMKACYTFTPDDYFFAQDFFTLPEQHGYVELPWHFDVGPDRAKLEKPQSPHIIMVGHNAHPEGHHQEVLESLSRYSDENIRIVSPLSYGPKENRDKIIACGKRLFGEKFDPLLTWVKPVEYRKLLQSVSVFAMGIDRQAGTFNMNLMLRLGCKVYAKTDTSLWSYFTEYCGCSLFDIDSIGRSSFEELISFTQEERCANSRNMSQRLTPNSCLRSWKAVIS
jgi:dTDP-N-acetylfucosamine:lipid II N-acetylfucosaminyltransferase